MNTPSTPTPSTSSSPVVGAHGCYSCGSDRYPCTVVQVSPSGHKVVVETDETVEWKDHYGRTFARREGGVRVTFTRRANGDYRMVLSKRSGLSLTGWASYSDPSF